MFGDAVTKGSLMSFRLSDFGGERMRGFCPYIEASYALALPDLITVVPIAALFFRECQDIPFLGNPGEHVALRLQHRFDCAVRVRIPRFTNDNWPICANYL